jgi:hypothetical protein
LLSNLFTFLFGLRIRTVSQIIADLDKGKSLFLKVLDTKISRLQSGFSSNSYGLPANIDWSSKIR